MKHVHLQNSTKKFPGRKSAGKAAGFFDATCDLAGSVGKLRQKVLRKWSWASGRY
jgi:hypothetical protein